MGANFTPSWNTYKDLKPFRFWCQKVLPSVYDDSLSYYELLCKVVNYLNVVIENLEGVEQNTDALLNAFNQLQGYVNEYFEDVLPQLVSDKLDEMVEDGTFDRYINPIIEQYRDDIEAIYQQYAIQGNAFVEEAEAWAKGTKDGVDVPSTAPQYHDNSKYWANQAGFEAEIASDCATNAATQADIAEAWAKGTKNNVPVASNEEQYHNNSKYWAEQAGQIVADATYANEAQAWANGAVNGTPVDSSAPQYENNAKYYAEQAAQAAANATYANEAQAWATGEVNGTPVGSSDPQYHNNAKYYADEAASAATAAVNTAVASLQTQIDTVREVALEGFAWVKVSGVQVKASRTLMWAGDTQGTLNVPGLICINLPYSDSGSGTSTLVDSNSNVEMFKKGNYIFAAHAVGSNMLRTNKYLIQMLTDGYANATIINGVSYENHFLTVWDYTTGNWAADGVTIDLELLVGKIRYKNNGTALNSATIGQ